MGSSWQVNNLDFCILSFISVMEGSVKIENNWQKDSEKYRESEPELNAYTGLSCQWISEILKGKKTWESCKNQKRLCTFAEQRKERHRVTFTKTD